MWVGGSESTAKASFAFNICTALSVNGPCCVEGVNPCVSFGCGLWLQRFLCGSYLLPFRACSSLPPILLKRLHKHRRPICMAHV